MNKEIYTKLQNIFIDLIPKHSNKWLNLVTLEPLDIKKDFVYPNSITQLRPGNGKEGMKMPFGVQYIVIHDTGMIDKKYNAVGLNNYIHDQANNKDGRVASWHFSIDDKDVFQHIPTDEIGWHAGDGSRQFGDTYINSTNRLMCIGGGNQSGIGIETCINRGGNYNATLKRTARLVADLLIEYNLPIDRVKQHYDFSGKNCPNIIRSQKGLFEIFIKDVEITHSLLLLDKNAKVAWKCSHPEIIDVNGGISIPLKDTIVELSANININQDSYVFKYSTIISGMDINKRLQRAYYYLYTKIIPKKANGSIVLPSKIEKYEVDVIWKNVKGEFILNNIYVNDGASEALLYAELKINGFSEKNLTLNSFIRQFKISFK